MGRFGGEYHSEFPEKYVQRTIETMAFGTIYEIQPTEFVGVAEDIEEVMCIARCEDGKQRFAINGTQEVAEYVGKHTHINGILVQSTGFLDKQGVFREGIIADLRQCHAKFIAIDERTEIDFTDQEEAVNAVKARGRRRYFDAVIDVDEDGKVVVYGDENFVGEARDMAKRIDEMDRDHEAELRRRVEEKRQSGKSSAKKKGKKK